MIGRYELRTLIASGGQSDVYGAWDPLLQRDVVMKVSRVCFARDEEKFSRLIQEGRILSRLKHSGIVQVFDVGVSQGRPYLVLERIEGESLQSRFATERPPARLLRRILSQIAEAVDAVHREEILHLDLKPENVLITARNECKLIDFGVALSLRATKGPRLMFSVGTDQYMAPEQCRGETSSWNCTTDIYGLGGIVHFLQTGRPPPGTGSRETEKWCSKPCEIFGSPRSIAQICRRALAPEINKRFRTVSEFRLALQYPQLP